MPCPADVGACQVRVSFQFWFYLQVSGHVLKGLNHVWHYVSEKSQLARTLNNVPEVFNPKLGNTLKGSQPCSKGGPGLGSHLGAGLRYPEAVLGILHSQVSK